MATRRPRRLTLKRSVEEAMRRRLCAEAGTGEKQPPGPDLFPGELEEAIDQALLVMQQRRRVPGAA